jgi:hypothetical protein
MKSNITNLLVITLFLLMLAVACTSAPVIEEDELVVATPATKPIYRSARIVSTDCGVEVVADPPPGFAVPRGSTPKEMPEMIAKFQAVGAEREIAETDSARVSDGYVMVEPLSIRESMLIDNNKNIVASFSGDYQGGFTQLLPDGNRLVSSNVHTDAFNDGGGYRGCVEEYASDGSLLWRLNLSTENYIHHHDVVKMDNGNILAMVWEKVSVDEVISQGRNPDNVAENGVFWYDGIIEVNPFTAEIVWEWSARHHLIQEFDESKQNFGVVADHPELLDINLIRRSPSSGKVSADWTHNNALDYNPELDQIVFSSNYLNEIYVIDHSTTPIESMGSTGGRYGMGGDILYRWGNPANYGRGSQEDQKLFRQHDVQWIRPGLSGAGNLLVFNNGDGKLRPYSTVVEFTPPMNADGSYDAPADGSFGPDTLVWEYNPQPSEQFFSWFISGAQRLPNGNTFVNHGAAGKLREVTPEGDIVWEYHFTTPYTDAPHGLFRANRYPADHPGVVALILSE